MSITNGYATLEDAKNLIVPGSGASTVDDTVLEFLIEAASRYIDSETRRTFYGRTETRYFDIPDGRKLKFDDDLLSITTFTNGDGTTIASTEYNLVPKNNTPYYALKLKESSTIYWLPDSNSNTESVLSILGSWGYMSSYSKDINLACLEIAKTAYRRRHGENTEGVARITSFGVVITPQDVSGIARDIIRGYTRRV